MEVKDLTTENLKTLIDLSNSYNNFPSVYLTLDKALRETPEDTFLYILWLSNFEIFEIHEFKDVALEITFKKELEDMPRYINDNQDYYQLLNPESTFAFFNWIPIVARWRLTIGL
jgi:hypothetical protein